MSDAIKAETVTMTGHGGDEIEAYLARPLDGEPHAAVAVNGYAALCPTLYAREAPGASPDDASAFVRAQGGVPDERLVGDVEGAANYLRALDGATGKVGVIGHCSGGRHAFLAACSLRLDAAVDCYGAFIVEDAPEGLPKALTPILHLAPQLSCPMLGLFGKDDRYPGPEQVATLDAE